MPIDVDRHEDHRRSERRASIGARRMRVSDGRRHSHDAGSRRRTPGDTARAASPIPPVAHRGDNPTTGPPLVRGPPREDMPMLTLDHARARHDATALLHAAAIDACRRAVDACARRMLAATGTPTTSTIACASRWTASRCLERPRACSRVRVRIRRPRSRSPNPSPRAARSHSSAMVQTMRRLVRAASAPGPAARCGRRWRRRACAARPAEACVSRGARARRERVRRLRAGGVDGRGRER